MRSRIACSIPSPDPRFEKNSGRRAQAWRYSTALTSPRRRLRTCTSLIRPAFPRASASASKSASVRRTSSCSARPSIGWKPGAIPASAGKAASSDWQKLWMVWIFSPPGQSSTLANNCRARSRVGGSVASPSANRSFRRSLSLSRTHLARRPPTRLAISAAAALVKVRQRIDSGRAPLSSKRNTRAVRTCVLPVPADAESEA